MLSLQMISLDSVSMLWDFKNSWRNWRAEAIPNSSAHVELFRRGSPSTGPNPVAMIGAILVQSPVRCLDTPTNKQWESDSMDPLVASWHKRPSCRFQWKHFPPLRSYWNCQQSYFQTLSNSPCVAEMFVCPDRNPALVETLPEFSLSQWFIYIAWNSVNGMLS